MKVIIAGGGTGGHVFPAIAIGKELVCRVPGIDLLFVGAQDRLEMEKVPAAGFKIIGLWISGFQRKLSLKNLMFPIKLIHSTWKSNQIIKNFKPDVVIGVGGYASGPILKSAQTKAIPTVILESNSYAGLTNRILGAKASAICTAFSAMDKFFPASKVYKTGNPVRQEVAHYQGTKEDAVKSFNLDPTKKTIIVLGGSLGAGTINQAMIDNSDLIKLNDSWQWIWQCGRRYMQKCEASETFYLPNVKLLPFVEKMDALYAAADIAIARAGALTIAEICLVGLPSILVPSPNVAEDHQTKNALSLTHVGAASYIADGQISDKMISKLTDLLGNRSKLETMRTLLKQLAKPNATSDIVSIVVSLSKKGK